MGHIGVQNKRLLYVNKYFVHKHKMLCFYSIETVINFEIVTMQSYLKMSYNFNIWHICSSPNFDRIFNSTLRFVPSWCKRCSSVSLLKNSFKAQRIINNSIGAQRITNMSSNNHRESLQSKFIIFLKKMYEKCCFVQKKCRNFWTGVYILI